MVCFTDRGHFLAIAGFIVAAGAYVSPLLRFVYDFKPTILYTFLQSVIVYAGLAWARPDQFPVDVLNDMKPWTYMAVFAGVFHLLNTHWWRTMTMASLFMLLTPVFAHNNGTVTQMLRDNVSGSLPNYSGTVVFIILLCLIGVALKLSGAITIVNDVLLALLSSALLVVFSRAAEIEWPVLSQANEYYNVTLVEFDVLNQPREIVVELNRYDLCCFGSDSQGELQTGMPLRCPLGIESQPFNILFVCLFAFALVLAYETRHGCLTKGLKGCMTSLCCWCKCCHKEQVKRPSSRKYQKVNTTTAVMPNHSSNTASTTTTRV